MAAAFGIDAAAVKSRQVGDVIDDPALRGILTDAIDKVNGCEISAEKSRYSRPASHPSQLLTASSDALSFFMTSRASS